MDTLRIVTDALAQARPPSKPWFSCPRVLVRCSVDQVDELVEAARALDLTGPSGTYFDPVDLDWFCKDMILWDAPLPRRREQAKRITFVFSKEHVGEPVIESDSEPRLMTAIRRDLEEMGDGV